MRVVILSIGSKYVHASLAPWVLAAGLAQYGARAEAVVVEATVNQTDGDILAQVMVAAPDVLACCCYIWNIDAVSHAVSSVRQLLPGVRIVLGGPEVSHRAQHALCTMPDADYVIAGPGEYALAQLVGGAPPEQIPGLAWRGGETPQAPLPLPTPDPFTDAYFAALKGRIAYVETSRGCPFACAFCLSGLREAVTYRPLAEAKRMLLRVAQSGARTVKLVDRTFNCDEARAQAIFAFLIDQHQAGAFSGVTFHFEVAADLFGAQTLALLARAPQALFQFEAGIQSFHAPTLEAVRRRTDLDKLTRNVRALLAPGNCAVHVDLIAGLPHEDYETFGRTFDRAYALDAHMLQLGFLKLLHGSALRGEAEALGYRYTAHAPYEVLESPWIAYDALQALHRAADALDRLANSGRFRRTLAYILEATRMRPFTLFTRVGDAFAGCAALSLDAYTERFLAFASALPSVQQNALRDALIHDRLATDRSGRLPACLRREDAHIARLARALREGRAFAAQPHLSLALRAGALGMAALSDGALLLADYTQPPDLRGAYPLVYVAPGDIP